MPCAEELPPRLSGVLAVLFLVFDEGYPASGPDSNPVRDDLTAEAIRLTRLITVLMSEGGEAVGLLALMLLIEARRAARVSASGELVTLEEQDRGAWDAVPVAEGPGLVRERRAAGVAPGRYQILAAINTMHTSGGDVGDTDRPEIVALSTCSCASTLRRSFTSIGPSPLPSSPAQRWHRRPSTVLRSSWSAITRFMEPRRAVAPPRLQ